MPLPIQQAVSLAKDMAKKGLAASPMATSSVDDSEPDDDAPPGPEEVSPEASDDTAAILADIDAKMPGLGALVQEYVERMLSKDDES